MMITLIHPSRGRPQKAYETAKKWIDSAGREVEYILSIDADDPLFDKYFFGESFFDRLNRFTIQANNNSVVEATNRAAKEAKGDILLYLSDDFDCFDNWAIEAEKEFLNEDRPLLVKVDDCLQPFNVAVLTIPIMNRKLYERLGYFWHPDYKSMFVDEDLYWTARKLGALKYAEHLKFPHNHVSVGKAQDDETYRRSSSNWDQGKQVFNKRKGLGFPV